MTERQKMQSREEAAKFCQTFEDVYIDYPFDDNWVAARHKGNKKCFAFIFERNGRIWVNVKCDPEWCDLWRTEYASVLPAYHMNKTYWNSVILDGSVSEGRICDMIAESYAITKERPEKETPRRKEKA